MVDCDQLERSTPSSALRGAIMLVGMLLLTSAVLSRRPATATDWHGVANDVRLVQDPGANKLAKEAARNRVTAVVRNGVSVLRKLSGRDGYSRRAQAEVARVLRADLQPVPWGSFDLARVEAMESGFLGPDHVNSDTYTYAARCQAILAASDAIVTLLPLVHEESWRSRILRRLPD